MIRMRSISRRGARRLLTGATPAGGAEERLAAVLDVLARPVPDLEERAVPAQVLTAFASQAGHGPRTGAGRSLGGRAGARSRRLRGAFVLKVVAVAVVFLGGAVAAAAADALPAPAQRVAHVLLGSVGVPAPSSPQPSDNQPGPAATRSSNPVDSTTPPTAGASSTPSAGSSTTSSTACATAARTHGTDHACPTPSNTTPGAAAGTHASHPGEPSHTPSVHSSNAAQ